MGQRRNDSTVGRTGEELARSFLQERGFSIREIRYRYGHGEIDIVAEEEGVLVFCEVKTRRSDRFGAPEYAVTRGKQKQIRTIAEAYLYEHQISDQVCRFDVIAIRLCGGKIEIRHIRDAF